MSSAAALGCHAPGLLLRQGLRVLGSRRLPGREHGVEHPGIHRTWRDRVDVDARARQLRGERLAEADQPAFGRRVGGESRARRRRPAARYTDDLAPARGAHVRRDKMAQADGGDEVDLERGAPRVPVGGAELADRPLHGGVIDQDVHRRLGGQPVVDDHVHGRAVRHVDRMLRDFLRWQRSRRRHSRGRFNERRALPAHQPEVCPLARECHCGREAEPARRARDERRAIRQAGSLHSGPRVPTGCPVTFHRASTARAARPHGIRRSHVHGSRTPSALSTLNRMI